MYICMYVFMSTLSMRSYLLDDDNEKEIEEMRVIKIEERVKSCVIALRSLSQSLFRRYWIMFLEFVHFI
jgi:hypothetical protein